MQTQECQGLFIALEGIDGCGKSTQMSRVHDFFQKRMLRSAGAAQAIRTFEPGGTPMAWEIRETLKRPRDEPVHPMTETLLFFAARQQHLDQVIRLNLRKGNIVITDRFLDSTYSYQAAGGRVDIESVNKLAAMVVGDTLPDLTFVFVLDPQLANQRRKGSDTVDRLDAMGVDYYTRAQNYLLEKALTHPAKYVRIDASGTPDDVFELMRPALEILFDVHQYRQERRAEHAKH